MHHTEGICKKNYINKGLMDMYLQENDRFRYYFKNNNKDNIDIDLLSFLTDV